MLSASPAFGSPSITLGAQPSSLAAAGPATLTGEVPSAPPGTVVDLYQSPYPYTVVRLVATTTAAADGSFSFSVRPDRRTLYRAELQGTKEYADVRVDVGALAITKVKALTLGRALVTVLLFHPRELKWGQVRVHWSFASGYARRFTAAASTRSRRLGPHITV